MQKSLHRSIISGDRQRGRVAEADAISDFLPLSIETREGGKMLHVIAAEESSRARMDRGDWRRVQLRLEFHLSVPGFRVEEGLGCVFSA